MTEPIFVSWLQREVFLTIVCKLSLLRSCARLTFESYFLKHCLCIRFAVAWFFPREDLWKQYLHEFSNHCRCNHIQFFEESSFCIPVSSSSSQKRKTSRVFDYISRNVYWKSRIQLFVLSSSGMYNIKNHEKVVIFYMINCL